MFPFFLELWLSLHTCKEKQTIKIELDFSEYVNLSNCNLGSWEKSLENAIEAQAKAVGSRILQLFVIAVRKSYLAYFELSNMVAPFNWLPLFIAGR